MATNLVVRNVEEEVALALKQRAALHGRSAEAEHREILRQALHKPKRRSFAEALASMPDVGTDADFEFVTEPAPASRSKAKPRKAR